MSEDLTRLSAGGEEMLEIRIEGAETALHEVPAAVLAQVLQSMQHTIHLLAMNAERREVRQRARIPADIEKRFVLKCRLPVQGSYVVPAVLDSYDNGLFEGVLRGQVLGSFHAFVAGLAAGDAGGLRGIAPDSALRRRIAESIRSMSPQPGSKWRLRVLIAGRGTTEIREDIHARVRELLAASSGEVNVATITGRLERIDFGKRVLTIVFAPTGRALDCHYSTSAEELLLSSPRELIHVTGRVICDEAGNPNSLTDVEDISAVDTSPYYLSEVELADRRLQFIEPLVLTPELDESEQFICVRHQELGIDVCASTRDDLEPALQTEIDVLWRNYASAGADAVLTPEAQRLAGRLRDAIREVPHAT